MRHILVVDDDERLRKLLKDYLSTQNFRITTVANASQAKQALQGLAFDLIVLDVMMPGQTGVELTAEIREKSDIPILLLTALGEADNRVEGLATGADDYLTKPFDPRELVLRIEKILNRTTAQKGEEVSFGDFTFDMKKQELRQNNTPINLTTAEANLLEILARNIGRAMTRQDLKTQSGIIGEDRAVDVQMTRLRKKIEQDPGFPR